MFYMFSGPDFLYANAFYPKAKTYVLAGLEPVGTVPDLTKLRAAASASALYNCRPRSARSCSYSFFITKQMSSDLRAGPAHRHAADALRVPGALGQDHPRGHPGHARREGRRATGTRAPGTERRRAACRIVFAGSDGEARTLYYFSTDLSNGGVEAAGS